LEDDGFSFPLDVQGQNATLRSFDTPFSGFLGDLLLPPLAVRFQPPYKTFPKKHSLFPPCFWNFLSFQFNTPFSHSRFRIGLRHYFSSWWFFPQNFQSVFDGFLFSLSPFVLFPPYFPDADPYTSRFGSWCSDVRSPSDSVFLLFDELAFYLRISFPPPFSRPVS